MDKPLLFAILYAALTETGNLKCMFTGSVVFIVVPASV